jgi:Trk-type K+ transport system membrane component
MPLLSKLISTTFVSLAAFWCSIIGLFLFVFDFGFPQTSEIQVAINIFYTLVAYLGITSTILRYIRQKERKKRNVLIFDFVSIFLVLGILLYYWLSYQNYWINDNGALQFAVFITFIRAIFERNLDYTKTRLNPAQLFILSFLVTILIGTLLLMLPNATHSSISFIDALFTSTSAVCVTGLIVVDTGSFFTPLGQMIIICLIQIGGIGILTFASYFGHFFREGTTFENQILLRDLTNSQKISGVFDTIRRVLIITFTVEIIGMCLIYYSIDTNLFSSWSTQLYFSFFHSISSFCNAGFSILPNSLYEGNFRYDYSLQLVTILIFVLGGLGFPIVSNLITYIKYLLLKLLSSVTNRIAIYRPWVLNLDSKITLTTTGLLILIGSLLFLLGEYNHSLAEHNWAGKITGALFGATTPRTAGLNTIDMTAMSYPTILLVIFLMWVGASPASTGGGIKTSTFALAFMNFWSLAKGKEHIDIFGRNIASISIRRAFAIMTLSLMVIVSGIIIIGMIDPQLGLLPIIFECFSAYSTVGLSLGITADFSLGSKIIIIIIMFIGRVSMLSILIAILRKVKFKYYRLPTEEITMN